MPNRPVEIPKGNGKFRTLRIPCIRDRVVQGALKLILEAIFEADFCPNSLTDFDRSEIRDYVKMKIRTVLTGRKRRRKSSVGWRRWSNEYLYDVLGPYWDWKIQPLPGVGSGT